MMQHFRYPVVVTRRMRHRLAALVLCCIRGFSQALRAVF